MPTQNDALSSLLAPAIPFLRSEHHLVDPDLPAMISSVISVGAGECWHKDNNFLGHLVDVYRILKLWNAPDPVARCGLFHSVYSNSYVDLIIFDPNSGGRDRLRSIAGEEAERIIYLFCVVPRQTLLHDDLLFQYTEGEMAEHLKDSAESVRRAGEDGTVDPAEPWRKKVAALVPAEGIKLKHISTGEDVALSRRMVATFILMTMADFSDQLYAFQDELFENDDGKMNFAGNKYTALWPGDGRPGLWLNSISRMGALYTLISREEHLYLQSRKTLQSIPIGEDRDENLPLIAPPIFDRCTKIVSSNAQRLARDLYWEVMAGPANSDMAEAEKLLKRCSEANAFIGEPHLVLGQVYMACGRYEEAEKEAEEGLRILLGWGSPWDKRISWEGWVAWGRMLLQKAKERSWPNTSFGIIGLGLVR